MTGGGDRRASTPERLAGLDLVITSYGSLLRVPALAEIAVALCDPRRGAGDQEPGAKQTRAAKALKAHARIALTGTPVENRLGDLWSIFDFINPGPAGFGEGVHRFTSAWPNATAQSVRPAARAGAALHPAAAEDRQVGHRRPAGQDRGQGVLPPQPQAGGALRAGGEGSGAAAGEQPTGSSARAWCWRS